MFTPNYNSKFDLESYSKKKIYDDISVRVVMPSTSFSLNISGDSKFVCFLTTSGGQFGEAIPYTVQENDLIELISYDSALGVTLKERMTLVDSNTGEFIYNFSPLDFNTTGNYTSQVLLNGKPLNTFTIIVYNKGIRTNTSNAIDTGGTVLPREIIVLSPSYIKTNVVGVSFKITDNTNVFAHFIISDIVSVELLDKRIILYTEDQLPTSLVFNNSEEAEIGSERIDLILNGNNLN